MAAEDNPILVVDDDAASRHLLARTLTAAGYVCAVAGSGEEALERVRRQPPSLLLLDYDMPDVDGAAVLRQLRADPLPEIAQVPTIMLTGHGGEESEVHCLEAGADDFVTKPIHPAVLKARIETQLRLRSMRDQVVKQNEQLQEWRQSLEEDLAAAQRTQRSLIPQRPPALPGWEVAAFYRPVIQVGGDIYDWLRMRDGRVLFWIADATGHGAAAALLTTLAKLLFHHASVENDAPAEIMRAVDRDFRSILGARSFMTAMCVALDSQSGKATVVGAGHPPLLVARRDGATESIPSESPPLGLVTASDFRETPVQLGAGDLFLLYTDGLYATARSSQRRLTPDHLAQRLHTTPGDAQALLQLLLRDAVPEGNGDAPADDIAAMAVRRQNGAH
ncbi:MAG: SpoIIE family protein phosphatase [Verrucomicrobia bacterium]|nr:SpoIIE family protein phosphatase [Verrucomicrobiota bacterium]